MSNEFVMKLLDIAVWSLDELSQRLMKKHGLWGTDDQNDALVDDIRVAFRKGVHVAYQRVLLEFLEGLFQTQQDIATELGLTDRTSISKMKSSGRMKGELVTWVLHRYADKISFPSRQTAAMHGLTESMYYLARLCEIDTKRKLTTDELQTLVSLLSTPQGAKAAASGRLAQVDLVIQSIAAASTRGMLRRQDKLAHAEETLRLKRLFADWSDFCLICLGCLPEEIQPATTIDGEMP